MLERNRAPRTFDFAIPILGQRHVDTSIFASSYQNDEMGGPAYDPKSWLQGGLFASARGLSSSRQIAPAGREPMTFMALACGMAPDHSTLAACVASRQEEMVSLFRAIRLVGEEHGL